ncbi:MAG: hypothetical protein H0A76_08460 [Candidatus Thiodubiliella endoseptemdiera]|uniref:Uncharacterized protein n=1 Tax=Candidatus Thiodubiliella endoseptemdiera TaxID=2738886 RepID=A0A853F4H9_9GAMM|nr:hypothetical protein [Candidatus Thiodubiliella endoseptemdiera]
MVVGGDGPLNILQSTTFFCRYSSPNPNHDQSMDSKRYPADNLLLSRDLSA